MRIYLVLGLLITTMSYALDENLGLKAYRQGQFKKAGDILTDSSAKNSVYSDFYIGQMRLYGYGLLKNNQQAWQFIEKSASKGLLAAQNMMALHYLLDKKDYSKALHWFKKAAENGDERAMIYCAAAYHQGLGTKPHKYYYRKYIIDAAKAGNAKAQVELARYFLNSRHAKDRKLGLIWLNKAVSTNFPPALMMMAKLHLEGRHVEHSNARAKELLTLAMDKNIGRAYALMGDIELQESNYDAAKAWYLKGAQNNNTQSQRKLSKLYFNEKFKGYDPHQGYLWMLKAAQLHSLPAQIALANMYLEGQGVDKNEALAQEWLQKAKEFKKTNQFQVAKTVLWISDEEADTFEAAGYAFKGILTPWKNKHALQQSRYNASPKMLTLKRAQLFAPNFNFIMPSQISVVDFYQALIQTVPSTPNKSIHFPRYPTDGLTITDNEHYYAGKSPVINESRESCIESKDARYDGMDYLSCTIDSNNKDNSYATVNTLVNQATLGNPVAQFKLGQMYENGILVQKNLESAIQFYKQAARQNSLPAEYALGRIYLEDTKNSSNQSEGQEWLFEAAFEGNPFAQYVLAQLYEKGYVNAQGAEIIKPDPEQSRNMYFLAAASNYGPAQYDLATLLLKESPMIWDETKKQKKHRLIRRLLQSALAQGVEAAQIPLAYFNAESEYASKRDEALQLAKHLAGSGNSDAALLLGLIYIKGQDISQNINEGMYWLKQVKTNAVSDFILGTYYASGIGLNKSIQNGEKLLQSAANQGLPMAYFNLSILNHHQHQPFVDKLKRAKEMGSSAAGILLADYFISQAQSEAQLAEARDIYFQLAEKGDGKAQFRLGYMYAHQLGGGQDMKAAHKWLLEAANQGNEYARFELGLLNQLGALDDTQNIDEAKKWYKSIKNENTYATLALGFIYDFIDADYERAKRIYQLLAKKGNSVAQYNLALIYQYGKNQPVDFETAQYLFAKAANQGMVAAMTQLANNYFEGNGTKRNIQQALYWYEQAVQKGSSEAMYRLGLCYETGVGHSIDMDKAQKLYQRSAAKHNTKAQLALARMHQFGIGMPKNQDEAANIYQPLVQQNNAFAQYQLATIYLHAVKSGSQSQARKLLELANKNGNLQAKKALLWLNSKSHVQISFIEPVMMTNDQDINKAPSLLFLEALNEWSLGEDLKTRALLNKIQSKYPHYEPAQKTFDQLFQHEKKEVIS